MTCRNSASLRVRQSSGRVALYLVVWTLRSRTAESYANAGVRPVAIPTPDLPASASGIAMAVTTCFQLDYVMCYCVPPHHEGDTLRTLTYRYTDGLCALQHGSRHHTQASTTLPIARQRSVNTFIYAFGSQCTMVGQVFDRVSGVPVVPKADGVS